MARRTSRRNTNKGKRVIDERADLAKLIDSRSSHHATRNVERKDHGPQSSVLQEQFSAVIEKFTPPAQNEAPNGKVMQLNGLVRTARRRDDQEQQDKGSREVKTEASEPVKLSKRKLRKLAKVSLSELKSACRYPQVIEWYDCDAPSPHLLASIKSSKNVVPIPGHWQMKREYLSGRSFMEKRPFELPDVIKQTDIEVMRKTVPDKEGDQNDVSLKEASRARVQPKMGSLDIDYKKLHDVFFKLGANWRPDVLLPFGDLYYENRNLSEEAQWKRLVKRKRPGRLSSTLREIMGISEGQMPPWCMKMKNLGMPPGYPKLKVAGLNWGIENMKGEVYGEISVPSGNKKAAQLFGTIISIKEEVPTSADQEQPEKDGEKGAEEKQQVEFISEKVVETEPVTTPKLDKEQHTRHVNEDVTKSLYTVLRESKATEGHGNESKAVYMMPGTNRSNQEQDKATVSQNHGDEEAEMENFKF